MLVWCIAINCSKVFDLYAEQIAKFKGKGLIHNLPVPSPDLSVIDVLHHINTCKEMSSDSLILLKFWFNHT